MAQFAISPRSLSRLFGTVRTDARTRVHTLAQMRIYDMGIQLGRVSAMEYCIPNYVVGGRNSYVDVVWLSQDRIVAAFEIKAKRSNLDIVTTTKDPEKLRKLDSQEKFIVNVSKISGKAYFHKLSDAEV